MKKKSIPAIFRTVLMVVLIVSMVTLSFVMFQAWKNPGTVEEKVALFTYSQKATVDYQVNYRSNILTGAAMVEAGETYITEYLNNILTTFNYEFKGERPAEYKGQYSIQAALIGYRMEQNELVTIWKKGYELVPETPFEGTEASLHLTKELPISLKQYNDFAERFSKETKINSETNLVISWNVVMEANTDRGLISETLTPTLVIPINKSYFNISGDQVKEKSGVIEETIIRTLPVNTTALYIYGAVIFLSLVALALLLVFTTGSRITDPLVLKTREIFKKHGERLIALGDDPPSNTNKAVTVLTLEDLIKIADELCKPVFYKSDPAGVLAPVFYVFDEPKVYRYELIVEPINSVGEKAARSVSTGIMETQSEEA